MRTDAGAARPHDGLSLLVVEANRPGFSRGRCLQLFGGYGSMAEYPVSRHFVDARVQRIYGGANEVMLELIARRL